MNIHSYVSIQSLHAFHRDFFPTSIFFLFLNFHNNSRENRALSYGEPFFLCAMSSTLHLIFWLDGHFNYPHFPVEETEVPRGQITCRIHKPIKWRSRIWVQAVWFYNPLFNLVSQSDDVQTSLPSDYKLTFITAQTKTQVRPFESWEMAGEAILYFLLFVFIKSLLVHTSTPGDYHHVNICPGNAASLLGHCQFLHISKLLLPPASPPHLHSFSQQFWSVCFYFSNCLDHDQCLSSDVWCLTPSNPSVPLCGIH